MWKKAETDFGTKDHLVNFDGKRMFTGTVLVDMTK